MFDMKSLSYNSSSSKYWFTVHFFIMSITFSMAQVRIPNPSFEVIDVNSIPSPGWALCESSGDALLYLSGPGTPPKAWDGNHYLSFLPAVSGSKAAAFIKLSTPVRKDSCHNFSFYLVHNPDLTDYQNPTKLRIYAGSTSCSKEQLIFESPFIKHSEWQKYTVRFTPKMTFEYITFEAGVPDGLAPSNSNLHLDNFSLLRQCDKKK